MKTFRIYFNNGISDGEDFERDYKVENIECLKTITGALAWSSDESPISYYLHFKTPEDAAEALLGADVEYLRRHWESGWIGATDLTMLNSHEGSTFCCVCGDKLKEHDPSFPTTKTAFFTCTDIECVQGAEKALNIHLISKK